MRRTAAAALLAILVAATGCPAVEPARVGGTPLVQADGVVEPVAGVDVEVTTANATDLTLPPDPVVRLAVAQEVPWSAVEALVGTLEGGGRRAVMLVGRRQHVRAIELRDRLTGPAIDVLTYVGGKACVRGPGIAEAKCVTTPDHPWVEKSYVRQFVREAREGYGVDDVVVQAPPGLPWSDVVNALDGARTCCGEGVTMRVEVRSSVDDGTVLVPVDGG